MPSLKLNKVTFFLVCVFAIFLLTVLVSLFRDDGQRNLYVHQAKAFLSGNLNVQERLHDVSIYKGKNYVPFPPFPAVLLMPCVAFFGSVSPILIALILTFLNVYIFVHLLKKLHIERKAIPWLVLAFFCGTGYWLAVKWSHGVWHFAHVVSVTFMLLAIYEATINGRGITTGVFLGCAFLSRQLTIYSSVYLFAALLLNPRNADRRAKIRETLGFVFPVCFCIAAYLLFNRARFDSMFDTGYSRMALLGFLKLRVEQFGLFHPIYFPFNFIYMFLQGPHIEFSGELLLKPESMNFFGTSLTFASPFVFCAFFAKWNKALFYSAWISICLTLLHMLFYYNNGWGQINTQRFTLDFLPVLVVLVALSVKNVNKKLFYISIIYSVSLNILSFFVLSAARRLFPILCFFAEGL